MPDFTGELGGALAMSFGAGCAVTYAFMQKTFVASFKAQLAEHKEQLKELREKVDDLQEQRILDIQKLARLSNRD